MGYECPVCGDPQADARHLANHLAFTALLGREDHEAWLEEHAPGWADDGERELADRVADRAEETEYPQVFEDTAGRLDDTTRRTDAGGDALADERSGALFEEEAHGHEHAHPGEGDHEHGDDARPAHRDRGHGRPGYGHEVADVPRDPETDEILEEARALTRRMRGSEVGVAGDDETDGDETGDDVAGNDATDDDPVVGGGHAGDETSDDAAVGDSPADGESEE